MDLILKKGLTNGKYCFLGDFKYQNLVSDEITISKEKLPKNNLIDFEPITLIQNVRNAKSISRNAPILSGLFKEYPYELAKSDQGEVVVSFSKSREEKIEKFENIISKLHKDGVHGIVLEDYPKSFGTLLNSQVGVIQLTTEAILTKSKHTAYLALLADPVVDNAISAERLLNNMIETQKDFLGYLN